MTYVKVCGLRTVEAALVAVEAGADAIGVVMSPGTPRDIAPTEARIVLDAVRDRVDTVLVTNVLDAAEAARAAKLIGASVLQLHGSRYDADDFARALAIVPRVWRATSLTPETDVRVGAYGEERLLLDAPAPGSGATWDTSTLAERRPDGPWLLAGGLTPHTVGEAIAGIRPDGVDVSSGVESSPGEKDLDLIRAFVAAAKGARA